MDPNTSAAISVLLHAVGFGNPVVGAAVTLLGIAGPIVLPQLMQVLPVADANSPFWYKLVFGILARTTGNTGHNAPIPPSLLFAGGIVPSPPAIPKPVPPPAPSALAVAAVAVSAAPPAPPPAH